MSRSRRLPIVLRAIGLLPQPIILENACLGHRDSRSSHASPHGAPGNVPSSPEPSIHDEREPATIQGTQWCRHEIDPALT